MNLSLPPPLRRNCFRQLPGRPVRFFLFLFVLLVTIASSFSKRVLSMAIIFDSALYLHSSMSVLTYLKSLAAFKMPSYEAYKYVVEGVLLDGPVLPVLGGTFYLLLRQAPTIKVIGAALFLQAILHATAALLVYKITHDLTRRKPPAIVAALAWGLYPAAILGAGKFMTEIVSCCLLLSLIISVIRIKRPLFGFLAGVFFGLLALTKAALVPASALVIAFGLMYLLFTKTSPLKTGAAAAATICGATLIIVPWVNFTYHITGKMALTTNRQPTYNLVSGVNRENDGWASVPDTPLSMMFSEADPPLPSALGIAESDSDYEFKLLARKLVRLFAQPWNDYRWDCLIFPVACQLVWHKLLLVLGGFGLVALLFEITSNRILRPNENSTSRQALIFSLLTIAICGHLVYLPFVACGRYAFTAMPLFTILATVGLGRIFSLGKEALAAAVLIFLTVLAFDFDIIKAAGVSLLDRSNYSSIMWITMAKGFLCAFCLISLTKILQRKIGLAVLPPTVKAFLALLFAVTLLAVTVDTYCQPDNKPFVFHFAGNSRLRRSFILGQNELSDPHLKAAYLLIDTRLNHPIKGTLCLNGKSQDLIMKPYFHLHPAPKTEEYYELFARLRYQSDTELNLWYASQLPIAGLKAGKNEVTAQPAAGYELPVNGCVTSRYLQGNYITLPSLSYFSANQLMNDLSGFDARPRQLMYIASGKGKPMDASVGAIFDPDYESTNLNALIVLVYDQDHKPEAIKNAVPENGQNMPVDVNLSDCRIVAH